MKKGTWVWVSLANAGEGLPYAIINIVLLAMLADLQVDAGMAIFVSSLCALPWSLKALWSPVVETYGTRKSWMMMMQMGIGALLIVLAFSLQGGIYLMGGLALLIALLASTYDIACDGHYMRVLPPKEQAYFVGIRTTAYRIGMLLATGGMTAFCGWLMQRGETVVASWRLTLLIAALVLLGNARRILSRLLPQDKPGQEKSLGTTYLSSVRTFFTQRSVSQLCFMFAFLFCYRLGESLLSKVTILFLKDETTNGGLALNNEQYGLLYGTCGVIALILGGILGGMAISRFGFRRCLIPMALAVNLPDLLYVWLALSPTSSLSVIGGCIGFEQFGYGFGLAAYTVYILQCSKGQHETAHYAFLTAIMGLSLTLPSMISGFLQASLGYGSYFVVTCLATLPGILLSWIYCIKYKAGF